MHDATDMDLLRQYAEGNSDAAFGALVSRHVNLVYSAALRKTGNLHAAEEITQAVFIILAQKAGRIPAKTILPGWLYQTARLTASSYLRGEIRRIRREQEAYMQTEPNSVAPDETWEQLAPLLDDAMGQLSDQDRAAVVLRFFGGKSFAEVATAAGVSENAAKKRVSHALEKLHRYFARRGVSSTVAIIAGAISANSVHAAPMALAKAITALAVAKGAAASGSTLTLINGALKIMAWTKVKTAIVVCVGVLLAAGTATVTVKQIKERTVEDSWRVRNIGSDAIAKLPPEVKILPTKFSNPGNMSQGGGPDADKFVGIGQPVVNIVWAAYDWAQARTIFANPEPTGRYDFITTLAQGSREALQRELKNKLGLVGRRETKNMDVLFLKVQNANAPGLHPPTQGGYCYLNRHGNEVEIKWADEPLSQICGFLESGSKMPIIDQTGMAQHCSIDMKWEEPDGQDSEHKALQQVLLAQLGLELVPGREPVRCW